MLARRLIEARAMVPFARASALRLVPGMESFSENELDRLFSFASGWFRVRATGDVNGAMRSVEALLERESGVSKIIYLLPRRGPNIVGLDAGIRGRIDDPGLLGASQRPRR